MGHDGDTRGDGKRRVADLLASYIPTEEALLLRSGRYACTVCPQRPVFDTLAMLTVHRAGRKHAAALRSFYGGKRPLGNVAPEQLPAELVPQDSAAPLLARTRSIARSALLKAAPYSSRCRRTGAAGGGSGAAARGALGTPRSQALERYLQLRSAGWIPDGAGKWVKDENAEFDSDEDEPPGLPPGPGAAPSPPQAPC
ncbi:sodium channel modifier 1 [Nothoprocta perdicaria]|uniref:sodium channel modifier 1 n=1 Tax=Nothoprocta perdicaria TaxID=30464 RepID=UPI000E1B954C|nr:sodium channel modifier 1 [Nothoprocta perdicaria]